MGEEPHVEQEFICTFGVNHPLGRCYVVITATTEAAARSEMYRVYGPRWAFVYDSREAAGVERYGLSEVPFGTSNEEEPTSTTPP